MASTNFDDRSRLYVITYRRAESTLAPIAAIGTSREKNSNFINPHVTQHPPPLPFINVHRYLPTDQLLIERLSNTEYTHHHPAPCFSGRSQEGRGGRAVLCPPRPGRRYRALEGPQYPQSARSIAGGITTKKISLP